MISSFQTPNLAAPNGGSLAASVALDFTQGTSFSVDLTQEFMIADFNFVQSVYIDNADNSATVDVFFYGAPVPQRIRARAFSQGWYPVSWPKGSGKIVANSNSGAVINTIFANFAMPYSTWSPPDGTYVVPPLINLPLNVIALGAGSNTQLVAGAGIETVKLYRGSFSVDGPTILKWTSGPGGAVLFTSQLTAGGSMFFSASGNPWFNAAAGSDLTLNSSAACNLYGGFGYVQS